MAESEREDREARLARALRANLRRRKARGKPATEAREDDAAAATNDDDGVDEARG